MINITLNRTFVSSKENLKKIRAQRKIQNGNYLSNSKMQKLKHIKRKKKTVLFLTYDTTESKLRTMSSRNEKGF